MFTPTDETQREKDRPQAAGGLLGGSPSPAGAPPAPLEHQHLLDLIDEGASAVLERAIADEQMRNDALLRAMISPRYAAAMAELERKVDRSRRVYVSTFKRFFDDCEALGLCHLPATPGVVAAYLETLRDLDHGAARLRREKAAISFIHRDLDFPDPTDDPLVEAIIYDAGQDEKKPRRHVNGKH